MVVLGPRRHDFKPFQLACTRRRDLKLTDCRRRGKFGPLDSRRAFLALVISMGRVGRRAYEAVGAASECAVALAS